MDYSFPNIEAQLTLWMLAMIRPGTAFMVSPIFGAAAVPVQLRILLALALAIPVAAGGNIAVPPEGMVSLSGVIMILSEALIGLAIGFALQIGFAAALVAGETISNTMGLGFAAMNDPASGQASPAIGQFLSVFATFLFLALDGHLLLAAIIVDSFSTLPAGQQFLSFAAIGAVVKFGSILFAAAMLIALPTGFALILVQIMFGIISRSAPTLNLFAVGLPATLMIGVLMLALTAPVMIPAIEDALMSGVEQARLLAGGG
jgi:flagellar biosynthetic protein FliR